MMVARVVFAVGLVAGLVTVGLARAADEKPSVDATLQGEYSGEIKGNDGSKTLAVQVIALGGNKFRAVGYTGGLPGAGWDKSHGKEEVEAELKDGAVTFAGKHATGVLKDGVIEIKHEGAAIGTLKKVERKSPTLGMAPPAGAIVLFNGKDVAEWSPGKLSEDGLLMQGAASKKKFQNHTLHIEFRLPFEPEKRGQGRGNSGCYLQGRYEVQVLDSFGLEGKNNECGGIYTIKDPDVNMCFPPLTWQTYDIDYTAAKYENGKVVSPPKMTVRHNGVVVHKDVELPKSTTAAPNGPGADAGPVYLQDHGNQVRYRNIWVVEKP